MRTIGLAGIIVTLLLPWAVGCATYSSDLSRSRVAYERSSYEQSLAILRGLEPDIERLTLSERAQYAYLRGMSDHRIGYVLEARHWLGVAQAIEQQTPGAIPPDWSKRLSDTLKELNDAVFTGGYASLTNAKTSAAVDDAEAAPKRRSPRAAEPPRDDKPDRKKVDGAKEDPPPPSTPKPDEKTP